MEDRFIKYSKLYALIFLMFLAVPVILGLFIAFFYGISKLVSSSVVDIIFGLGVITLPPALFSSVYVIFFKRTRKHPSAVVRGISYVIFLLGFASCVFVLVNDMLTFFTKYGTDITNYRCFSLAFMAGNVGSLFLIAIIQAFTTAKEKDWIERNRQ